jgi:hypothetical protein
MNILKKSAVHRLRISGRYDHSVEDGVPRPPYPYTDKMMSTRLFHGNIRKQVTYLHVALISLHGNFSLVRTLNTYLGVCPLYGQDNFASIAVVTR